jgi:hypothetical protein
MTGVPRKLIEQELHLDPKAKPFKQRLRRFAQDKKDVIKREIVRLLDASFIKEVYHPDWLANPILIPKKNKDWRMCVNYTDLNKAYKKDPFGCPDRSGCGLHSWLQPSKFSQLLLEVSSDSCQGRRPNQDILHYFLWRFFYTTMPFGLKSPGGTYQRGIQRCLHSLIGRNVEACVDDVVVKTREEEGLISDLAETFDNLRKFKMKLNP